MKDPMDAADYAAATREAARTVNEANERIVHSFRAMAAAMLPSLRAFARQLQIVGEAIEETTRRAYEDAGSPYGDNREGKWRWIREMAEREQARQEAEELLAWQRSYELIRDRTAASVRAERERKADGRE